MAYYSGNASTAQDLVDAIVAGCTLNGWTLLDGVLSKGDNHFRPTVVDVHVKCEMGDSAGFVSPGVVPTVFPFISLDQVWPVFYRLFVLTGNGADTVVLSVREANAYEYKYLMFGNLENKVGSWVGGQWMHATYSSGQMGSSVRQSNAGVELNVVGGAATINGGSSSESYTEGHGPLFANMGANPNFGGNFKAGNTYIKCEIDTTTPKRNFNGGGTLAGVVDAFRFARAFLQRSPNLWNGEALLVPVHVYFGRASDTTARLGTVGHVRYMRMDNYEPGDIITLGLDRWMVLPMYIRNATEPFGRKGTYNTPAITGHSGQLAYAIKYDGP